VTWTSRSVDTYGAGRVRDLLNDLFALMAPHRDFPPELVEHILSFLPDGDPWLIAPLALVSHSWPMFVQEKLFGHIVLSSEYQWTALHRRLQLSAHLRDIVQTLDFCDNIRHSSSKHYELKDLFPALERITYRRETEDGLSLL
jgi:hypothetical protein